jgi:hypothetical protein
MKQGITTWKHRVILTLMMLVVGVAGVMVSPGTAGASGCRHTSVGEYDGKNTYQSPTYWSNSWSIAYWTTEVLRSPDWATSCRDVNIKDVHVGGDLTGTLCVQFRVVNLTRGYTHDWVRVCPGSSWKVVYSGIYTDRYYIDAMSEGNYQSARPYYSIMD